MKHHSFPVLLLAWRRKHISSKNFLRILSIAVGLFAGTAATLLKNLAFYFHLLLTQKFAPSYYNYLYFIYPLVGILLTLAFAKFFLRKQLGHSITGVLYAISRRKSIIPSDRMYAPIVGGGLTVGFGGSAGLEAPSVNIGSAIGSNLGRLFHLNYKSVTLLLACGAAGAIAAIFNAPIAGIVFALEVLMIDLTLASLIPLLMASITGAMTGTLLANLLPARDVILNFEFTGAVNISEIPFYILLGILAGLVAVYFKRMDFYIEGKLGGIKNKLHKAVTGGVILGALIFLLPPLYGEGYITIKSLLANHPEELMNNSLFYSFKNVEVVLLMFLGALVFIKVIAMAFTLASGGVGGIFAPSLFVGGVLGFTFARTVNFLNLPVDLSESNYTLVGMAAMMSGILHAPLTAMFLIAEIANGYQLIVPLMIVSAFSYLTVKHFEPHSIYTHHLAKRGELITHHKDKMVLNLMRLDPLIERDFTTILPDMNLRELIKVVVLSKRNSFPVVGNDNALLGIVSLDNIRHIMFNEEMYDKIYVRNLMHLPPVYVSSDELMDKVMEKFETSGAWNLSVIDEGKYVGFVSKSNLFTYYRQMLIEFSEE